MLQHSRLSILSCGFVAAFLSVADAATANETVVHDTSSWIEIDLDPSTVLCSAADYGSLFLKVGIPELARITLLDHQNIGAGAPCVTAGICEPGHMPSDIIDPARPSELVQINVKAVRFDDVDGSAQTCTTHLIERVHLTIRGFEFTHERFAELGTRPYSDCASADPGPGTGSGSGSAAGTGDTKADDASTGAPASGGCASTGGTSGSFGLIVVGAIAMLRRRRRL